MAHRFLALKDLLHDLDIIFHPVIGAAPGAAIPAFHDLRPGKPIRYARITDGEIDLDLGDKAFSWHADIETPEDEHSEFPDRPAALETTIPGSLEQ